MSSHLKKSSGFRRTGSVLVMILVLLGMLFAMIGVASVFINRQFRLILDQEQEEKAFHVAEAGIHYTLFLLSKGGETPQSLVGGGGVVRSVTDPTSGEQTGTYSLSFTPGAAGNAVDVRATGWDMSARRCQIILASIGLSSITGNYGITAWDHVISCDEPLP